MDFIYLTTSAYNLAVALWCCTFWKDRTKQIRFLMTAFYSNAAAIAVCFSLQPRLGPVEYAWLFLLAEVGVASALLLVLFGICREVRPPAWTLISSAITVLTAVVLLWPGSWVYTRIMMSIHALGVAGAMSCTLASFSKKPCEMARGHCFALTALAAFFGTRFASVSGLIAFLLPFKLPNAVIGAFSFVACWSLFAWGLRAVPSSAQARQFERRIAEAARILGRNLQ